jgi:hypothetical protein
MELRQHVQEALGVASPITESDLAAHVATAQFAQTTFGLSGTEFASAAANATSIAGSFIVTDAKRVSQAWKYLEILVDGAFQCAGVCTPEVGVGAPPTAAAQVLVGAWLSEPTTLVGNALAPKKCVYSVMDAGGTASFPFRLVKEWSQVWPLLEGSATPPIWVSKDQMQLLSNSRLLEKTVPATRFQDLLLEAVSEVKAKWRYLSIYRILEHGYLATVFETLRSSFFSSPKESIASAATALDSELNQFFALAQNAALQVYFESLHDAFYRARASGNRFASALEHSLNQTGQVKLAKNKSQKGVLICYKTRCAIVHAGASSPIFDAYPDGPECLEIMLPECESALLQFVGITAP